jgi:hypothetical protein
LSKKEKKLGDEQDKGALAHQAWYIHGRRPSPWITICNPSVVERI